MLQRSWLDVDRCGIGQMWTDVVSARCGPMWHRQEKRRMRLIILAFSCCYAFAFTFERIYHDSASTRYPMPPSHKPQPDRVSSAHSLGPGRGIGHRTQPTGKCARHPVARSPARQQASRHTPAYRHAAFDGRRPQAAVLQRYGIWQGWPCQWWLLAGLAQPLATLRCLARL